MTRILRAFALALAMAAVGGAAPLRAEEAARRPAAAPNGCPARVVPCCSVDDTKDRAIGPLKVGFQVWPLHHEDWLATAVKLRPGIVRFSIGPYPRDEPPLPANADYATVRARVAQSLAKAEAKWRASAAALRRLEREAGAFEQLLIIWEPPLSSLDSLALRQRGSSRVAHPQAVEVNARYYVALIEEARRLGFRPDSVEIANEPDGGWNMQMSPQIYLRHLQAMRRTAKAAGVPLPRIAGPGLAFLKSMATFMSPPELARAMLRELDTVSVHIWDDRVAPGQVALIRQVRRQLDDLGWRAPILVSEYAPSYPLPQDRTAKIAPDRRRAAHDPKLASEHERFAPATLDFSLALAAEGFNPLVYWELMDPPWGSVSYGLLDPGRAPRPALAAFAELSRLARAHEITGVVALKPEHGLGFAMMSRERGQPQVAAVALTNIDLSRLFLDLDERRLGRWVGQQLHSRASPPEAEITALPEACAAVGRMPSMPGQSFMVLE